MAHLYFVYVGPAIAGLIPFGFDGCPVCWARTVVGAGWSGRSSWHGWRSWEAKMCGGGICVREYFCKVFVCID